MKTIILSILIWFLSVYSSNATLIFGKKPTKEINFKETSSKKNDNEADNNFLSLLSKSIKNPHIQNIQEATAINMIKLHVSSTANSYSDEIYVNFTSTATENQGVTKWFSMLADAPSLYSVKNGSFFTINTLPFFTDNLIVPVSFIAGINGNYTIIASEINSFTTTTYIYLKDLKTNYIQLLNQNAIYSFTGLTNDNPNRFQLIFSLTLSGWLGNVSSDWANSANWVNGSQPILSDNIIVNSWASRQPHITSNATSPAICNNLIINSGSSLTIDAGKALTVNGSLINNAGISGLLMKSDANGTASLINASTNINASAERYIANDNSWHFISSPIANQVIKPNFAPIIVNQSFDFYKWNPTIPLSGLPWINIRDNNGIYASGFDNFETARGYLVAYSSSYSGSAIHSFDGYLNSEDQLINISHGINNYNLIGNPYPSALNWNDPGLLSNAIQTLGTIPAIWIWNQSTGNYGVYSNGNGTNLVSNVIAPHQGFFVNSISNGILNIPASAKIHPGNHNFLKETPSNTIKLHVSSTANSYSDEMIVNFSNTATPNQGVVKWFSMIAEAPSIYSVKNGVNYSINTLTQITDNLAVPVYFKAGVNSIYTINASELISFDTSTSVYLKDLNSNVITDLKLNANYTYPSSTTDSTYRFQLIFKLNYLGTSTNILTGFHIFSYDNVIHINTNEFIKKILIYNTMGQIIKYIDNKNENTSVNMNKYPQGYYIVRVITNNNAYSEKVFLK
ncbi:MAG: T9SS type A sorting domain-containing protein [Bacteroidales bacterium]